MRVTRCEFRDTEWFNVCTVSCIPDRKFSTGLLTLAATNRSGILHPVTRISYRVSPFPELHLVSLISRHFADAAAVCAFACCSTNFFSARTVMFRPIFGDCSMVWMLWAAHAAALRARIEKPDRDALHALCWLATDAAPKEMEALDAIGWKKWKDSEFAASYLFDLKERNALTVDSPELTEALGALPEDAMVQQIRLDLVGANRVTIPMLVDRIKAEYRTLSPGLMIRDSYTLKGLFYELKQRIAPNAAAPTAGPAKF